jgi:hypothetical protein
MESSVSAFKPDLELIAEHRAWLDRFARVHRENWERLLRADTEAAACEAGFRRLADQNGCAVEPNEQVNERNKKPDFSCRSAAGKFYLEVTCIQIKTVIDRYGLSPSFRDLPKMQAIESTSIVPLFFKECCSKAEQCSGMDAPTVLGIGTFHRVAAWMSFETDLVDELLTGSLQVRLVLNSDSGRIVDGPIPLASLDHSLALKYGVTTREVTEARQSISALVVASPDRTIFDDAIGIIHPEARRPFKRHFLPRVPFRRLFINRAEDWCRTDWADDDS